MSNTPHILVDEFPGKLDAIHALKLDPAFARLLRKYAEINDQMHCPETCLDSVSQGAERALPRKRLQAKDRPARWRQQVEAPNDPRSRRAA